MTETIGKGVAYITALELGKELQRVLNADPWCINSYRQPLKQIRDRLDTACRRYEDADEWETFEEEYLLLFDALSFLNEALQAKKVSRGLVQASRDALDKLRVKGGAL